MNKMEGVFGFDENGEFFDDETRKIDSLIEMSRGHINIMKRFTLQNCEKRLKELEEFREKYVENRKKEIEIRKESINGNR